MIQTPRLFSLGVAIALAGNVSLASVEAAEIWNGPTIQFSKAAYALPTLSTSQDRITNNVWLTRGDSAGLFNARTESIYTLNSSPADTEWSYGTTADIGSLTFANWRTAVNNNPPASVGQDMVVHLITDDIYIDIKFLSWGTTSFVGGYFSYERSTPVPEPCTLALELVATVCLYPRRHNRH